MDKKIETTIEMHDLFKEALGRELSQSEQAILNSIVASDENQRITFMEMMKELINKKSVNPAL